MLERLTLSKGTTDKVKSMALPARKVREPVQSRPQQKLRLRHEPVLWPCFLVGGGLTRAVRAFGHAKAQNDLDQASIRSGLKPTKRQKQGSESPKQGEGRKRAMSKEIGAAAG